MSNLKLIDLKGMGEKTLFYLNQANIFTVKDLLNTFPKSYESFNLNQDNIYIATITTDIQTSSFKVVKSSFKAEINQKEFQLIVFQRPYLKFLYKKGDLCIVKGQFNDKHQLIVDVIKPIEKQDVIDSSYHITGVLDYRIRHRIQANFDLISTEIEESLDQEILSTYGLMTLKESYQFIHNPLSLLDKEKALLRLKIEEAITFYKYVEPIKPRPFRFPKPLSLDVIQEYMRSLPFLLTEDQFETVHAIVSDLNKHTVMERLVQGDVGSGKTIVAFLSSILCIQQGYQVAFMSPTEVLSEQHFETFKTLFKDIQVANVSSSTSKKTLSDIALGKVHMVFGTHKLAYPNTIFNQLSLVIIDEQHKFGVEIRKKLREKSLTGDLLYLTATPIPRSLMHVMYGHASLSSIKSIPSGRGKVSSHRLYMHQLGEVHQHIEQAIIHKQHVFVVVPAISYSESKTSIMSLYPDFIKRYPKRLCVLHGEMSKEDQLETITKFKSLEGGVLLSTTMVEVGIDIKTATFMIVLDAENFGVSQLHQLRGRIGRGSLKGIFYMLSKTPDYDRLKLVSQVHDGFELSEHDLTVRGAGHLLGYQQSGHKGLKLNNFLEDYEIFMFVKNLKQFE